MTLPSSGAISIGNIQSEFGGSPETSLSEYYAGGSYVLSGQKNGAGSFIPSSGQLSISDFYGATKDLDVFHITAGEYKYDFVGDPYNDYDKVVDGYSSGFAVGSTSPSTSHLYGTAFNALYSEYQNGYHGEGIGSTLVLSISGAGNSGWSTMIIDGVGSFARTSASYSSGTWTWDFGSNSLSGTGNYYVRLR